MSEEDPFAGEYGALFLQLLGNFCLDGLYYNQANYAATKQVSGQIQERAYIWSEYSPLCQSPIEKRLFAHLLFIKDPYFPLSSPDYPYSESSTISTICPQGSLGVYAADFLITVKVGTAVGQIVVECDGHDFHEKTKQQAARDRARDRSMTTAGIRILRFTGSEIFNDSPKCAGEVADMVDVLRHELDPHFNG